MLAHKLRSFSTWLRVETAWWRSPNSRTKLLTQGRSGNRQKSEEPRDGGGPYQAVVP